MLRIDSSKTTSHLGLCYSIRYMTSYTPDTNLWLERSRLSGMLLGMVSYGAFIVFTIQATVALCRRLHDGQAVPHKWILLGYVWITFGLGTVGIAGNSRYTEIIWIGLRDKPGGPAALIADELDYPINLAVLTCYYIMEWFMQAFLVYRCSILWERKRFVTFSMCAGFLSMVVMGILSLVGSVGGVSYRFNIQGAYIFTQVGLTTNYTIFVIRRLFTLLNKKRNTERKELIHTYETIFAILIESVAPYTALSIFFTISAALRSNISELIVFAIFHVQGISQLLIIIRMAEGKALLSF